MSTIGADVLKNAVVLGAWGGALTWLVAAWNSAVSSCRAPALIVSRLLVRSMSASVSKPDRRRLFVCAVLYSLGHGGNDAQKTLGIVVARLYVLGKLSGAFHVGLWIARSCQAAMALGAMFCGWGIVHIMGSKTTRQSLQQDFCAGTGRATVWFFVTDRVTPLSTIHRMSGAHG